MHMAGSKTPSFLSALRPRTGFCSNRSSLFFRSDHPFFFNRSVRPTISSTVLTPSFAMYSRSCCAIKVMKLMTYSGFPIKCLRSSGFLGCDTHRTGVQVADTHHDTAKGYQRSSCKAEFSAPRSAAIATSLPLMSLPSVSMTTRFLRLSSLESKFYLCDYYDNLHKIVQS